MKKRQISTKNDVLFLAAAFLVSLAVAAAFSQVHKSAGAKVEVSVDGSLYGAYSLWEDQEIPIEINGVTKNVLSIREGMADMVTADCPDQLCVHQKAISKSGETIVCLPHRVVVEVIGSEERELDGVAK